MSVAPASHLVDSAPPMQTRVKKPSALQHLLAIESDALNAIDRLALKHIAVNKPRSLMAMGHILWINRHGFKISIAAISSQSTFDKTTPFAQWITHVLQNLIKAKKLDTAHRFSFQDLPGGVSDKHHARGHNISGNLDFEYPFSHAFYAPFAPHTHAGGLLFTRDTAFTDSEIIILTRLGQSFGANWAARSRKLHGKRRAGNSSLKIGIIAIFALIACIPVPMTELAPAEIVADKPFIITAPFDGVIDEILVPPNTLVDAGTVLARLNDISYRNEYIMAGEERALAEARMRQAALSAFTDIDAKKDIAISKAQKALAHARENYAKDRLSHTTLTSPRAGLAIYSDPKDWTGRPVSTGEAIIEIAEPSRVLLRIHAPLASGERLRSGTRVRLFLDADPVNPLEARLESASFYAREQTGGHMAYTAYARFGDETPLPRIGARGVAKIYGGTAPFGFWIFRRPITILRQFIGL